MSDRPLHVPAPPPSVSELVTDDGEPMETTRHWKQMTILKASLGLSYRGRPDFYVGGNEFVYFSETQARNLDFRGPDVYVVLGVDPTKERKAWVVWDEDGRMPDVVIELTSPSTRAVDHGRKKDIYARTLKVDEYFIFDPYSGDLEGFDRQSIDEYTPKSADERGFLRCHQLGLWLGKHLSTWHHTTVDWLRWIDDDGNVLPVGEELAEAALEHVQAALEHVQAAEDRAQSAEGRAQSAEGRAQSAEGRARSAEGRARSAEGRATTAEGRAKTAEERLAEYERRFGKLE